MINKGMMTSNKQDWTTPIEVFKKLDDEFHFECDLFASDENALCDKFFTEENDVFDNVWYGMNFANPPYDTKIQNLAFKCAHHNAVVGKTTVMLVPARTDTRRFHDFVFKYNYEIRFIKGRLKFGGGYRMNKKTLELELINDPAPFPSCIIIFKGEKQ